MRVCFGSFKVYIENILELPYGGTALGIDVENSKRGVTLQIHLQFRQMALFANLDGTVCQFSSPFANQR